MDKLYHRVEAREFLSELKWESTGCGFGLFEGARIRSTEPHLGDQQP